MNKCIDSIGLIAQKAAFERKVRAYVDSTGYLKGKLDFDELKRIYDGCFDLVKSRTFSARLSTARASSRPGPYACTTAWR